MAAVSPAVWPAAESRSTRTTCSPHKRSGAMVLAPFNSTHEPSMSSTASRTSPFRPLLACSAHLGMLKSLNSTRPGSGSFGELWEDPDDEYDSELEDINGERRSYEEEENVLIGEEQSVASSVDDPDFASEDEKLRHEVYLLLSPEERAILEQNKSPNLGKISSNKWRPLQSRALSGQIPFMGALLQNGLDIDSSDKDGLTALHWAVIGKKEAVISHLLRRGANPHLADKNGATPLHHAVQVGALQTVKLLIKYKVDVNAADHEGWTPLHLAVQGRSREISKILLVNGADKYRKNKDGKTPLDLSLCYGKDFKSYELAKLIKLVPANQEL